jgi:enoyl-CoA hydratase/carnithine racemase
MSNGTQNLSKFEVDGHVAQITLNRPEAMNSLNPELRWELSHHFDEVERNDDIWVAVVTGAGERAFCAGADLKHRAREREADESQRSHWEKLTGESKSLIERWHFPKPIIARVNGFALGGGYMLTGRHMSAQRAYELGLVNEVVPLEKLDETVGSWVADILRCAPLAVRATKEATMKGLDHPLAQAYYTLNDGERRRRLSDDALEGPRAFAEKRAPNWKGS